MRRMDRYQNDEYERESRLDKNQDLYQNISSNAIYTNITDVTNANAYELGEGSRESKSRREQYQQMQMYQPQEATHKTKKELDDFNYLYHQKENKVYDINSVLEQARKNRGEVDAREEKRKLKNNSYNILTSLNKEELEKYREERKKRINSKEEEEIRELIDTIASKTLAGEIDKATSVDLLSDLMATNILDKVDGAKEEVVEADKEESREEKLEEVEDVKEERPVEVKEEIKTQILEKEEIEIVNKEAEKEENTPLPGKDPDFYTRSMDLSDKDFDFEEEFKDKPISVFLKILLVILILAVIAVAGYFIYQRFI